MRMLQRLADCDEEFEPFRRGEIRLFAVFSDLDASHQLHDEVGTSILRRARIEHFGDIRMIHHGERLTLLLEAGNDFPRVHPEFDNLERYPTPHRTFLFGNPNGAETTLP